MGQIFFCIYTIKLSGPYVYISNNGLTYERLALNQIKNTIPPTIYETENSTDEEKHIFQYDGNNNITEDIYQNWNPVTSSTRNYIKRDYTDFQTFQITTGIDQTANDDNTFILFPNPNQGKFQVQSSTQVIEGIAIYNIVGEKVYSINNIQLSTINSPFSIDLSAQPKGIYFLQIINENKNIGNRKIIIQ